MEFRVEGITAALATLTAVATLALVLPSFTTSVPGPVYSPVHLAIFGAFLFLAVTP